MKFNLLINLLYMNNLLLPVGTKAIITLHVVDNVYFIFVIFVLNLHPGSLCRALLVCLINM